MRIRHFLFEQWENIKETFKGKAYIIIVSALTVLCGIVTGVINHRFIAYSNYFINGNLFTYRIFGSQSFFGFFKLLFSSVFIQLIIACLCGVNKWSAIVQYVFLFVFTTGFTAGICNLVEVYSLIGILLLLAIILVYDITTLCLFVFIIIYTRGNDFCNKKTTAERVIVLFLAVTLTLTIICAILSLIYILIVRPIFCFV